MKHSSQLALLATLVLSVVACGGGGGGSGGATVPPATPPTPPAIDSTRVAVATGSLTGCVTQTTSIDAAGNALFLWCDPTGAGTNQLIATRVAPAASAAASAVVEQGFAANGVDLSFRLRPAANNQFVLMHTLLAGGVRARVLGLPAGTGAPTVTAAQVLHADITASTPLVADNTGQLFLPITAASTTAGLQTLGGGLTATPVAVASPFAQVASSYWVDGAGPGLNWAVLGKQAPADVTSFYLSNVGAPSGAVTGIQTVSTTAVRQFSGPIGCYSRNIVQTAGNPPAVVAWLQLDDLSVNCELHVQGRKLNAPGGSVFNFAVTGSGSSLTAVWAEARGQDLSTYRLRWSRFDAVSQAWSAPAPVAPAFELSTYGQFAEAAGEFNFVSGPNATLALVWSACQLTSTTSCQSTHRLVSKLVAGAWVTASLAASAGDLRGLAINAAGQGVLLTDCNLVACQGRSVYRF